MLDVVDLPAYFLRIGMPGPHAADLATLQAIIAAHEQAIPFENLDPLLGCQVELGLHAIQKKLVHDHRGGYCFEQNLLLGEVLRAIGYEVTNLVARVLWGQPDDAITARSHMVLQVKVSGQAYLVDVGFGGNTLTGALPWVIDNAFQTSHESFRLLMREGDHYLQCQLPDGWKTLYRFDLQPQYPIDYRASNYYTSTNPQSHFVAGLTVARVTPEGRLALRNRDFSIHQTGGASRCRSLRSVAEIRAVLEAEFLIRLPPHPLLDQRLGDLPAA